MRLAENIPIFLDYPKLNQAVKKFSGIYFSPKIKFGYPISTALVKEGNDIKKSSPSLVIENDNTKSFRKKTNIKNSNVLNLPI